MEIRKPKIKSIPYEEFKDNSSLENLVQELHEGGTNVVVGQLDQLDSSTSLSTGAEATRCGRLPSRQVAAE